MYSMYTCDEPTPPFIQLYVHGNCMHAYIGQYSYKGACALHGTYIMTYLGHAIMTHTSGLYKYASPTCIYIL